MPKRNNHDIWVMDLECTCERTSETQQLHPHEIIEIGLARLDRESLQITNSLGLLVQPEGGLSDFCTELTGITAADVEGRPTLAFYCSEILPSLGIGRCIVASWGDFDRQQFERECQRKGLTNPLGPRHLNVKTLHMLLTGAKDEKGMAQALEELGMPLEGRHHRGEDDARNIAKILAHHLGRMHP